ncbi:MAG: response regulator transcription factor [Chloroflexi bacterium]|uniref:Response regulator transcription factor n=1 Tax=Candidatus Chlorohelix allophototropha TaxID=3003348 RepID=A0A8T7M7T6_9CHLR|nr:response regulator transcription factor [Chloroflexota bacterium]WJW69917.1 response regulator transcription factor [Chloroflexota bacterium L227-S17]
MNRPTILVVDDDPNILKLVRSALEAENLDVSTAITGQQALTKITKELPSLAIVDLNLPDIHGFEVCRRLQQYAIIPVIMLTGVDSEDTIVEGINSYAEDYITKPFNARELAARVRRVLRRFGDVQSTSSSAEVVVDQELKINFGQHWAEVRGNKQELTPTESKLLHMLIRHAGQVLTTDSLLARVWSSDEEVYVEGLRVHIRRLREKIEPDPGKPSYILTERGVGYRFKTFSNNQENETEIKEEGSDEKKEGISESENDALALP